MPATAWPVGLLLDEVWLRARRAVVDKLAEASLWPASGEQEAFTAAKRRRGEELRDRVLLSALRPEDRRWLLSPAIFGASNRRFRAKTPSALAFGRDISTGMQAVSGHPVRVDVAEASAVFNFGISIFDLLHDTQPDLVENFATHFDRHILSRLHSEPDFAVELAEIAATIDVPEFRLILQVIAEVYRQFHVLGIGNFGKVTDLLSAAYEAELKSAVPAERQCVVELARTARTKSMLPFAIIGAIGGLDAGTDEQCSAPDRIVERVGTIFWRIDDLADIVSDARSGALNSLLVEARSEAGEDIAPTLTRLLDSRSIESAASEVRDDLLQVRNLVEACGNELTKGFDRTLACYVRAWLE